MVREKSVVTYFCEHPGCGNSSEKRECAERCEARGYVGPALEPGLILGMSRAFEETLVRSENVGASFKKGVPLVNIYILRGEGKPEGHDKVYEFLTLSYGNIIGGFLASGNVADIKYGIRHKWEIGNESFSFSSLERKLKGSMASIKPLGFVGDSNVSQFKRIIDLIRSENGEDLRKILENEELLDKLYGNSLWVSEKLREAHREYMG